MIYIVVLHHYMGMDGDHFYPRICFNSKQEAEEFIKANEPDLDEGSYYDFEYYEIHEVEYVS